MDERPDESDSHEGCGPTQSGTGDEPLSGELLPLGDAEAAAGLRRGLKPIADDVGPERRDLAVALRRLFLVLDISVRGYAIRRDYSPSSVSRYLSGETVAPQYFVARLMDDVGGKLGRPLAQDARAGLTRMQRAALKATSSRAWKVQDLEDQLAVALREKEVARTQADVVATALHESRARIADLETERQALVQRVTAGQVAGVELDLLREEQHRVRSERDALRQRVANLERALEAAEQRVALAEQRVDDLEHELQSADAVMAAEEQRDGQRPEAEGSGWRARPQSDGPWPVVNSDLTFSAPGVAIVFPGYHRSWAAWIAQTLERHGHRPALYRWDPPREVPLEDTLSDLLLFNGRVLLVLNDWFFELGPRPAGEWNDVLRGFVAAHADRFAAVNLTNRPLLPATAVLRPASLWALGEEAAEERLLSRLGLRDTPRSLVRYPDVRCEIWGEVPRRNPRFTGRDELLNSIHERLADAERGASACTLLGMSGIGKTQLAAEYAHRFSTDYDLVWWVNSDDRNVLRDRFGELAVELGLSIGSEPAERIRSVRDALRRGEPYANWLVIFDGWDDSEGVNALLPQGQGHVLVTSRNRAWTEHTDVLEVPAFQRSESTGYLMRRAPHITATEADEVAAEFGDVPLPLVQAASWLGESGMEVPEYLRMVRERKLSTVDEPATGDGFPHSSMTSWSILLNRLLRTHPQALEVLRLCTSFAPGRIPLGLVHAYPQAEWPEELRWMVTDLPAWTSALDTLVNYSVLTRETRGPLGAETAPLHESVHMHRLVHDIVSKLTSDRSQELHRRAVRALLAAADPGRPEDTRNWPHYAELLPHLEHSGALDCTRNQVRETVLNFLRYCHHSGECRAGLALAQRVRGIWSANTDPRSQPMLDLAAQESTLLLANGRFRDAYEKDISLLESLETAPRSEMLDESAAKSAMARDLRHLGRYQEAYEAITESGALSGSDRKFALDAQHELGVCLRLLGRYAEAYEQDLTTLSGRERLLGVRHISTLDTDAAVSNNLRLLGRYHEATSRQEKLARRHEQELGPRHPQTLEAHLQLALCLLDDGATQKTGSKLTALLAQLEHACGRTHHRTLACITAYGNFLRKNGELSQARELIVEAESGYRAMLGPAHPVVAGMLSNTGLVMRVMGEHTEAVALFEAALAGLTTTLGADHPWALGCALNTAEARNCTGRGTDALELSRVTLARAVRVLGDEHPLTLSCQVALGADLRAAGQNQEAEKLEKEALLSLSRTLGEEHRLTFSAQLRTRPHWDFEPYVG